MKEQKCKQLSRTVDFSISGKSEGMAQDTMDVSIAGLMFLLRYQQNTNLGALIRLVEKILKISFTFLLVLVLFA